MVVFNFIYLFEVSKRKLYQLIGSLKKKKRSAESARALVIKQRLKQVSPGLS